MSISVAAAVVSTGCALIALGVTVWNVRERRREASKRDQEQRIARVNEKLVTLLAAARRASQGSPGDVNSLPALQQDLNIAIAAAHIEFPGCWFVATGAGVNDVLEHGDAAIKEVADTWADLVRGPNRPW